MNNNLEQFYDKIGSKIGYDFSQIKVISEGVKWFFYKEVKKRCHVNSLLLDIGTGGGERVLKIAKSIHFLVGIDISENMIKAARKNMQEKNIKNAKFFVMDSNNINFPDGFFDIISCRLSIFNCLEVSRLLTKDGIFMTQQASEADKINIKEFFGRGMGYGIKDGTSKESSVNELKKAGFSEVITMDYNAIEYYNEPKDLLFILKNTPLLPDFGNNNDDFIKFNNFINKYNTTKGIKTNLKRYMIIAKK